MTFYTTPPQTMSYPQSPVGHQSLGLVALTTAYGPNMIIYACECHALCTGVDADPAAAMNAVVASYQAHLPAA